jgi:hypothetical protein
MVQRAIVLLICLFLSACAGRAEPGGTAEEPSPEAVAILVLDSSPDAPLGSFTWEGVKQEGNLGTHCWTTKCVDFIGPPTPTTFTDVPGDLEIRLDGDGNAESMSVGHPPEEEFGPPVDESQVQVQNDQAQLNLEPGRYMLVVFATWVGQGDAVLTFGLDVA